MRRAWAVGILALVAVAGCDAPTRPEHTVRIERLSVSATQVDDGVSMQVTVNYPSDDGGPLRLGAPTLGSVTDVRVGGSPRSGSGETVDVNPTGRIAAVEYVVRGAVERYSDGVIVTLPIWTPPNDVSGDDERVPIEGSLLVGGVPSGPVHWHGASPASVAVEGQTITFRGDLATTTASEITFLLPVEAAPTAPLLPGASRVSTFEDRQASLDAADARIADDLRDDARREDLEANVYWGVVGLEIAIPFLITLIVLLRTATVRRRATRDVPEELSEQPSDLAPAAVALLHTEGDDIGAEAMAATILDLAHRGALTIEGVSGGRYTIQVVGSSQLPGEAGLLASLRSRAGSSGPPVGVSRSGDWWRALRRDAVGIARAGGLLRRRYPSGLFLAAVVALALTTLPLYARSPETIVAGIVVATILAAIPFVGGYVLTAAGHRERARWEAYRRHLAAADLADVPAPGVVVWERSLAYAAALGVATTAIGDLS